MDARAPTLGSLIDKLYAVREKRRDLAKKDDELKAEYAELEEQIKARLAAEETDIGRGKKATASISKVVVADIVDFDALCKYVKRTGYFHLFQRRISDPAFRELIATKPVPGLAPFTKINLNLKSL